ncbi:MAG TPA: stage IV sporulation protein A [Clostridia bacterium]|nr:stage IV sporulation protein A [Clostridia bacterium]
MTNTAANTNIYQDIATRTDGDIYIGVVGPVRTGKSTFIKRFMDALVLPNIKGEAKQIRANDELPQSSTGRTIMTTEPKFIPEDAVEITLPDMAHFRMRMIDCVGYIVPSSLGYIEDDQPRMVKTPWYENEIPFNMAAEIGTKKVISEHSTIGLVVTTDGSISDIPREEYEEAEERVINELKELNKPFIVLLNCTNPQSEDSQDMAQTLTEKYDVPVVAVNCLELEEGEIKEILSNILFEFPIKEVSIELPDWMTSLDRDHWLKNATFKTIYDATENLMRMRDVSGFANDISDFEHIDDAGIDIMDLSDGSARILVTLKPELFYKILAETTGLEINGEEGLMNSMKELSETKKAYDRLMGALNEVEATGYGIVMPSLEELSLEEPEIMRQGGRYGVRLRASAPSLHIMKANITTEVAPIVGSESQSEELVMYLLKEFEENPSKIWESNIFGKSLHELVNEGLHNKLYRMPTEARMKLQETLEKVINEGCTGLICIIL